VASENYFELFGLSPRYAIDSAALEQTWRALAARVHPDRYATASPAERRVAMQWASSVNEGYRILKSPLNRARYLCEQAGCDLQAESNTRMDGAFLMRQMEWREQLDEARELNRVSAFDALESDIRQAQIQMNQAITALIDQKHDFEQASQKVREWMFIEKLAQEVQSSRNDLTDRQD
jgi:molecular chaperone HscB